MSMIPAGPDAVTPAWLTMALRAAGVIRHAAVRFVARQRVGTGLVGQNVRFDLTYDHWEEGAPASVVGKFPSPDPVSRATGVSGGIYENEVRFYREIAPAVVIRVPACYVAEYDGGRGDFILLMEDLAPAQQGDQVRGCTVAQAKLAMEQLAGLHAPRWADASLTELEWLPQPTARYRQRREAIFRMLWPRFLPLYAESLPEGGIELGERFSRTLAGWLDPTGRPLTVTHGDYRIDNMMFGTAEGGHPLTVVDWQTVSLGSGGLDAAYFVGAGLLPEVRREREQELVRRYHAALVERGVRDYRWEQCWGDYRRGTLHGVLMAVISPMLVHTNQRGVEMFRAMAERHFLHALELEAEEFLR